MLAERRWTVIASATVTTLALVAFSAAVFGLDAWRGYLSEVIPYQQMVMRHLEGTFLWMLPSLYGALRLWGFSADSALSAHLVIAVPVFLVSIASFWLVADAAWRSIMLLLGTFLITPYALTYDLGMVSAAAGIMMILATRDRWNNVPGTLLLAATIALPIVMMPMGAFGLVPAPIILLTVYGVAAARSGLLTRPRLAETGRARS